MKSPTSTILQSIQALKSKLRSDHYQLQGIRRDFAMGPTRPIMQTDQRSQSPVIGNLKSNSSLQKNARAKLLQLRKSHQKQTKQLHLHYKKQKQEIIKKYENKIEQITKIFEQKINQQVTYITLLEEQAEDCNNQVQKISRSTSPLKREGKKGICSRVYEINCTTEMTFDNKINFKLFQNSNNNQEKTNAYGIIVDAGTERLQQETIKYERIVNKLLNQNAALLESVETLKMQNRRLKHDSMVKQNKENDQMHYKDSYRSKGQEKSITESRSSQYLSVMPLALQNQYQSCSRMSNPPRQANKNRLKFSKASERIKTQTDRSYSSIGNENIDLSNIQYRTANSIEKHEPYEPYQKNHEQILEEDEESILCQQMKLKTIKHFMKAVSHRSTECEDPTQAHIIIPQMAIKKGLGIRNALRRVSMV